jgi:hypothetical protein
MRSDCEQRTHARRRAVERFGFKMTRNNRAIIKSSIDAGEAKWVGMGRMQRPIFLVPLDRLGMKGKTARVIQEDETGEVVTLMPGEW